MTGALAYVALMSVKNRFLMTIRKMRNARYLISAIFGLGYLFLMFSRNFGHARRVRFEYGTIGVDIMAGFIFLIFVLVWAWPSDEAGIALSESEIQWLFAAPIRRGDILLYRFFRTQVPLIIGAFMTTLFGGFKGNVIGMWFFLGSLSLYMTMAQQVRARLKKMGIGFAVRFPVVIAIVTGTCWWAVHKETFQTPLIQALLYIPRFYATAALPGVPLPQRLGSFAVAAAIGVLCFFISARVDVDFEEGSIVLSQKKANAITRSKSQQSGQWMAFKRLPPPFRLADSGAPEVAIIWKNLIASLRIGMMPILILFGAMLILIGQSLIIRQETAYTVSGSLLLLLCAMVPLIGANTFSQDLRLDMTRIEYLKTFPISGERVVAAEMAAPMIVMSIVELLFLMVTTTFLGTLGAGTKFARFVTPQMMVAVFIFTVPICAILTVMRNAAVLLLPAWTLRSKEEPRGFVVTGQRLVVMIGNLIVLAVALVPAAVVFLPAVLIANRFFSGSPAFLAIATLPPLGIIAAEVWISVKMLGKYFDTFDASNELDRILT